jgi:ribosome-associated protein
MHTATTTHITPLDRALRCAALALDKKAEDVKILDIRRISSIADYLVLASGHSDKQTQAIAESVRLDQKKFGTVLSIEGLREGNWVILDYGDVILHAFKEEVRRYYDLDDLWADAPLVELPADYRLDEK